MFKPSISLLVLSGIAVASAAVVGCTVEAYGPPPPPPPVVYDSGPPDGGVVVDVLPPPPDRVYIYDPGYPPGCYSYGDYVYYGGYRYQRDVFVTRVVNVNVRENRYVNVEVNRRQVDVVREQDRVVYTRTGGRPAPHPQQQREQREERKIEGPHY